MFTQVDLADTVGKTVRAVAGIGNYTVVVSFTDNTFSAISVDKPDDPFLDEDEMWITSNGNFSVLSPDAKSKLVGLFGKESTKQMRAAVKAEVADLRKQMAKNNLDERRELYAELKAEFEFGGVS